MRVIFAAGGTGGHVFPALAIIEALRQQFPTIKIVFVGTSSGIESRLVKKAREQFETIWISGFARKRIFKNLLLPLKLAVSLWQSWKLIRRFKPDVVVGTGGYVMGPVLFVAQRMNIPTVIQEQNSLPGVTTKRLSTNAFAVCTGFADADKRLPSARVVFTGNPVRSTIRNAQSTPDAWNLAADRPTILVFGGSLGARTINQAIGEIFSELLAHYNLIWQTGRAGLPQSLDKTILEQAKAAQHVVVTEFIDNMSAAYSVANLAICRAGAMTLSELFLAGLPAILVPFPHAAEDHQTKNAESVVQSGGAILISDHELSGEKLLVNVRNLFSSPQQLKTMSLAINRLARPGAAAEIAEVVNQAARSK